MLRPNTAKVPGRGHGSTWMLLFCLVAALVPGSMQASRPKQPVEPFAGTPLATAFSHSLHKERAGISDCTICHHSPGRSAPKRGKDGSVGRPCGDCHSRGQARPQLTYAYHAMCINCHTTSDAAPVTCEGCHPGLPARRIHDDGFRDRQRPWSVFDHTAHTRRNRSSGCTDCHHLSRSASSLTYSIPGQECSDCHLLDMDNGSIPSLRKAYHRMCLACHEQTGRGALACGECHVKE